MINVPVNARVQCAGGEKPCGEVAALIVNPISTEITHLVVAGKGFPRPVKRLVPVDKVEATTSDLVQLGCTEEELDEMQPFTETHYIKSEVPDYGGGMAYDEYMHPYAVPMQTVQVPIEVENIPTGELAVYRGDDVEATDGGVGQVDELLVDPSGLKVTHMVLRRGHMWGQRQIMLPISAIDRVSEGTVHLKLSKEAIGKLPDIPAARKYKGIELIGRVYDTPEGASEALEFMQDLHRRKTIQLRTAAVLVTDAEGNVTVKETSDMDAKQGRRFGAIAGAIIGILGGPLGIALGAAVGAGIGGATAKRVDTGLSNRFLDEIKSHLKPNSSALVVLMNTRWQRSAAKELSSLKGIVVHETLTDVMVEQLLEGGEAQ